MIFKIKNLVILLGLLLIGWLSVRTYTYFFDNTLPTLTLSGIEEGGCYCGEMQCSVACNKKGDISIWLDGQPLISKFKISTKDQEQPFAVPTKTVTNGKHALKADFVDNSFRKNKTTVECSFSVDNVPLQAALVKTDSEYRVFQGRTLHVQFQVNKEIKEAKIKVLSHEYSCFPESKNSSIYECFIPISCEETPNEYLFTAEIVDRVGNVLNLDNKFQIVLYPFKRQNLQIAEEKVMEERALASANGLEQALDELAQHSPREKLWHGSFCAPVDINRVTCEFGAIRTTQQKGRYAHKALDISGSPKGIVWAPQDGVIVLKDRYEVSGNTVVIDHGCGVLSLFFHLDNFANINVGTKLAKGNPIGTIGKTGYATGYHLHWEMRVNNIAVDPLQWTKPTF